MGKFFIGMLAGVATAIAVSEVIKIDKVNGTIEIARARIYDAIGELVNKLD